MTRHNDQQSKTQYEIDAELILVSWEKDNDLLEKRKEERRECPAGNIPDNGGLAGVRSVLHKDDREHLA